ncbi:glycine zipper 2TM domain-containing protein [Mycobacterium canetti]|uniref:glycine zipper 2TM domain-containing protein n=1 Tax=Mycobacterium canetti TaxID=78331 RepID=UPI001E2FD66F|nr:glycine zipper 2TM domain-containing protein [Mycobacterium canetti]
MTHVLVLLLALLIGFVAGLRSLTAPAVVCWAAFLGWINLHGTWASWVGNSVTVVILSVLAVVELVNDKLPKTPPRTATPVFAVRILLGAFAGAVIGTAWGYRWGGLGAGVIGAVLGTMGGYQARTRLVAAHGGRDLPIALLEDSVAVLGGFAVVAAAAAL